ncbi:hypothetical protein [Collinsella sp. SGI.033]|uniref:hypothetical protein n=1 Tax=unclassified Collinsella TaxID=2637548 RepID=UPI003CFFC610
MAINRQVLESVKKECTGDQAMLHFLLELISYEMEGNGSYRKRYEQELDSAVRKSDEIQAD